MPVFVIRYRKCVQPMSFADWDRARRCSGLNFSRFCWFFCCSPRLPRGPFGLLITRVFLVCLIRSSPARIKTVCSTPSCLQFAKSLYAPGFILLRGENAFEWAECSGLPYGKLFYQLCRVGFEWDGIFLFFIIATYKLDESRFNATAVEKKNKEKVRLYEPC